MTLRSNLYSTCTPNIHLTQNVVLILGEAMISFKLIFFGGCTHVVGIRVCYNHSIRIHSAFLKTFSQRTVLEVLIQSAAILS